MNDLPYDERHSSVCTSEIELHFLLNCLLSKMSVSLPFVFLSSFATGDPGTRGSVILIYFIAT